MSENFYQWQGECLILKLKVQPRASRDEFCGPQGDALKLRITAPPVDGKANAHIIAYLAKQFGVAKRDVEIISGEMGRDKRVSIATPKKLPEGLDLDR
jgi:uncharacterized protein (TIGR00251 family)